jgi:hypothetical protein
MAAFFPESVCGKASGLEMVRQYAAIRAPDAAQRAVLHGVVRC